MKTEFKETQKFSQWWLWLILVSILIKTYYTVYEQLFIEGNNGINSTLDNGLIFAAIIVTIVFLMFIFLKLETSINSEGIKMNFFPFKKKKIKWEEVKNATVLNYGFVGGWGIRLWTKFGTVYNIKGNKGLFIELNNGKKFLIGTQREEELTKVIEILTQQ